MSATLCITDYVEAGVLYQLSESQSSPSDYGFVKRSNLIDILSFAIQQSVDATDFDKVVDSLIEKGIIEVISDSFAGDFYSFDAEKLLKLVREEKAVVNSILYKMEKIGLPFLKAAIEQSNANDLNSSHEIKSMDAPASDRVVRLDDNSLARDEALGKLDELAHLLTGHNDEDGKLLDRERLIAELRAGQELLKAPTVRVKAVWTVLGGALMWLMSEFGGSLVGEMAELLFETLKPLLGL